MHGGTLDDLWTLAALAEQGISTTRLLPSWHAVGSTHVCLPGFVRWSPSAPDGKPDGKEPCSMLGTQNVNARWWQENVNSRQMHFSLRQLRKYDAHASAQHGVVWDLPSNASWWETVGFPVGHNYCRVLPAAGEDRHGTTRVAFTPPRNFTRLHGITVLLSECHGNSNVGHAGTDMLFLAHVLARRNDNGAMPVRLVVTDDTCSSNLPPQGPLISHRRTALLALTAGLLDPSSIVDRSALKGDHHRPHAVVSDLIVQKAAQWTGDWRSATFYRTQAYTFCGVSSDVPADTIFLEQHGHHRRAWSAEALAFMSDEFRRRDINARRGQATAALRIVSQELSALGFCGQVRLFARSLVFAAHHGAAVWANAVFLPPGSVLLEIYPQYEEDHYADYVLQPPIGDSGSLDMAKAIGCHYVGSRSAFLLGHNASGSAAARIVSFSSYLRSSLPLGVNRSRWRLAVDLVERMLVGSSSDLSAGREPNRQVASYRSASSRAWEAWKAWWTGVE